MQGNVTPPEAAHLGGPGRDDRVRVEDIRPPAEMPDLAGFSNRGEFAPRQVMLDWGACAGREMESRLWRIANLA